MQFGGNILPYLSISVCGFIKRYCVLVILLATLLTGCSALRNAGMIDIGAVQIGMASWYGGKFHGRITTNGERYNMHKISAAHRTLPFGTLVRVTNLDNNKNVIVRINDRGPWISERVIDLSYGAAKKVDMVNDGVARVKLEVIDEQVGTAAWYGKPFHGRKTASGEIYNMNELTAAHWALPFGCRVEVTNVDNGEAVTVRINDRMPQSEKRVLNLSRGAAEKLGMLKSGVAKVVVNVSGATTQRK